MKFNSITIDPQNNDIRLDRYFKRHYNHVNFASIAKLIRKKLIKVNGKRADISTRLISGDIVIIPDFINEQIFTPKEINIDTKYIKLIKDAVIFKDENIIVINKPSGLAVQGGSKIKISVDDLSVYLQDEYPQKPKLVHRIDKDTTGLLVLARSSNIAAKISEVIKFRKFHKHYLAICLNRPKNSSGKIDFPLQKIKDENIDFEKVEKTKDNTKKAITYYDVLDYAAQKYCLIQVQIITGRTHQIRAHLSMIGCPILGDDKYGINSNISHIEQNKLFLHAYRLEFELLGKNYRFIADLPSYFIQALNNLGLSVNNK